jgi:hypothetical protein
MHHVAIVLAACLILLGVGLAMIDLFSRSTTRMRATRHHDHLMPSTPRSYRRPSAI